MHKHLEEARVDAVKSATEIINSISKHLVLKDLDLFLIDTLMTPRSLSFYSITDDWSDRDYRQVGMIYGGSLAILALILLAIGAFLYLPMLLVAIVAGRYFYLRHQLTKMARSKPVHLQTLKIARYLVLHAQLAKKKSLFKDMSVKYTMLKYIRDRRTITGADYLKMFTHIDDEVDFYRLLHGVIDDVLLYAVAQETSLIPEDQDHEDDQEDGFHHSSEPQEILKNPPERTNRDVASSNKNHFAKALTAGAVASQSVSTLSAQDESTDEAKDVSPSEELPTDDDASAASSPGDYSSKNENEDGNKSTEQVDSDTSGDASSDDDDHSEQETEDDIPDEFSLDDMDEEDYDLDLPESDDEDNDTTEVDHFEDIDDDVLEEIGLAEGDLR